MRFSSGAHQAHISISRNDHMIDEGCSADRRGASESVCHLLILATRGRIAARVIVNEKKAGSGLSEHWPQNVSRQDAR